MSFTRSDLEDSDHTVLVGFLVIDRMSGECTRIHRERERERERERKGGRERERELGFYIQV